MSIQEGEHLTLRRPAKRKEGSFVKRSRKDSKGAKAGQGWDMPSDHSLGSCLKRESKVSEGKTFKRKSTGQMIGLSGRSSTALIPTQELYSNSSSSHSRVN